MADMKITKTYKSEVPVFRGLESGSRGALSPHNAVILCAKQDKGVHILIPETCRSVTLHGKRDFVIKLRIPRWGDRPGLLSGLSVITRVLLKVRADGKKNKSERGKQEGQGQRKRCNHRSGARAMPITELKGRQPLKAGKGKERSPLWSLRKAMQPCQHLDFSLMRSVWDC